MTLKIPPLGEVLEWIAAACLVTAAALWSGLILALAVAGACLFYLAQVIAAMDANKEGKPS
jgi:hypothetical protein